MTRIMKMFSRKTGQSMVEYALIIALVAVALVAGLTAFKGGVNSTLSNITSNL